MKKNKLYSVISALQIIMLFGTGALFTKCAIIPAAETTIKAAESAAATTAQYKVAFESNRDGNYEIYIMNTDGSGITRLTDNPADDAAPSLLSNGSKIAFYSTRDKNSEIYIMNSDGSGQVRLTDNPADDIFPSYLSDGSKIVFESNRDGNYEIYAMNADGSGITRLTNNVSFDGVPAFSPDGSKIAFYSDRDGNPEIYIMNSDGSGQVRLTSSPAFDGFPRFSPDGSKIAFQSYRDGNYEIYIMNADGSVVTRLTDNPADDWVPSYLPDGTKIAFYSNRDKNTDLYMMNADGSGQAGLTTASMQAKVASETKAAEAKTTIASENTASGSSTVSSETSATTTAVTAAETTAASAITGTDSVDTLGGQPNRPPVVYEIHIVNTYDYMYRGFQSAVYADAIDPDGDLALLWTWTATGGTFTNNGFRTAIWKAPNSAGIYTIQVTVSDGRGGETTVIKTVTVYIDPNDIISNFNLNPVLSECGSINQDIYVHHENDIEIGDFTNNVPVSGFMSYDITSLAGATITTAAIDFNIYMVYGDPSVLGDFVVGTGNWGPRPLVLSDYWSTAAGDIQSFSTHRASGNFTASGDLLRTYLQNAINAGSTRFQIRMDMSSLSSDGDNAFDLFRYNSNEIYLTVTYYH